MQICETFHILPQSTVSERLGNKEGPWWGAHGYPWEGEMEELSCVDFVRWRWEVEALGWDGWMERGES